MGKIKLLNDEVVAAISAGEVVERPLSIVKELIENAIDAKSTRIEITITDGGKKLIRIKDNGLGMDYDDLNKCLLKHATSKISSKEDLFNIRTMGFRGEALYSISQVSQMIIKTKTKEATTGYELFTEFGSLPIIKEAGTSEGTLVEVRDLFKNVPVRKKFLKSSSWEKTLIIEFIESIALIYPHIDFIVNVDGRTFMMLNATKSKEERIKQLFPDLEDNLFINSHRMDAYAACAFVSKPDFQLSPFNVFSVNGRIVKDRLFFRVINDFFETQRKKSNFIFIDFSLPENEVDVNVHPSKKEVRFQKSSTVYNFLKELLEKTVQKNDKKMDEHKIYNVVAEEKEDYISAPSSINISPLTLPFTVFEEKNEKKFKFIGTFHNGYNLIEYEDHLLIIDQHAAHERLIYNRIMENLKNKKKDSPKIIPYVITTNDSSKLYYEEYRENLELIGYSYEDAGPKSIVISSIPALLSYETAIEIFIDFFKEKDIFKSSEDFFKNFAAMSACKEAIKKTTPLTNEEIIFLINNFFDKNIETYCPHGRNFIVAISLSDLEKRLGRRD